jgi:hypothetical protein
LSSQLAIVHFHKMKIVASDGKTLVVWAHGITDDVAASQSLLHWEQELFIGSISWAMI